MGTLVTLFFDDPALVEELRSGGGKLPSGAAVPEEPDVAASLRRIRNSGVQKETDSPEADIFALLWLCRKRCEFGGEIDHFRFEEEDFPELFELQFGDVGSPLRMPVCEETGLPAVNYRPAEAVRELAEQLDAVDVGGRPAYVHPVFADLKRWLEAAVRKGRGLLVFTEG